MSLEDRLNKIEEKIKNPQFLQNKGLGNEVGYYVFDYEAKDELRVREYIRVLLGKSNPDKNGLTLVEYDVYNLMIDLLESEDVIEDCKTMEQDEGMDYLIESVIGLLQLNEEHNYFANYIDKNTPEKAVVFITGIGKIFPFVRSHKILNNLHQVFDRVPVIMFYPGKYDGQTLQLFSEFKDDNYYRAFPLVK